MSSVPASALYGSAAGGVATGSIAPGGFPSGSMPSFLGGLGVVDPAGLRLSIGAITSGSKAVDALRADGTLANIEAQWLFENMPIGTPVRVVQSRQG